MTDYDKGYKIGYQHGMTAAIGNEVKERNKMTGTWKDNFPDGYKCSECGAAVKSAVISNYSWNIVGKMKYCPNCGADMRNKKNKAKIKYYSSISKDWLDIDRVSELLGIEKQCVERQPDGCNRECENCSLVQDSEELIEMYNTAINIIEIFKKYADDYCSRGERKE